MAQRISETSTKPVTLMEVCGTHTVSIFRSGIRSLMPPHVRLLSGPGCPVCVTPPGDIDALSALSFEPDVTIATFGDLVRVPGSDGSLQAGRAMGADIRVVQSAMEALLLAVKNQARTIVFAGVGFETTAPTVAAAIREADRLDLGNFFVYSAHKLTPPAIAAVMNDGGTGVDGLILPGHVSAMTGAGYFEDTVLKSGRPAVVAGFEPVDLLRAVAGLIRAVENGETLFANMYERAVTYEGNRNAMALMHSVFDVTESRWRGLGTIPESGLAVSERYRRFDAAAVFGVTPVDTPDPPGCSCGKILTGRITPLECPLYKRACTPATPVGPCMVSGEGTCAAYYHYHG
jgi:hydrogenase expression/formation protein HypD